MILEKNAAYERKFHKKFLDNPIDENKIPIYIEECLNRTKVLSNIISISTNEKEFFLSLNEMNRILYDLTLYEDRFNFEELPSKTLRMLYENRVKLIDQLYKRIKKPAL